MPPKRGTKRKAVKFEEDSSTEPAKKQRVSRDVGHGGEHRISPVDRFNQPEAERQPDHLEFLGYLKAPNGVYWGLPKVAMAFRKMRWRYPRLGSIPEDDDGLPVSPKTIATYEQMSATEREAQERWEDERFQANPDRLDPDSMSAFYPGLLKLYGMRQVPWD